MRKKPTNGKAADCKRAPSQPIYTRTMANSYATKTGEMASATEEEIRKQHAPKNQMVIVGCNPLRSIKRPLHANRLSPFKSFVQRRTICRLAGYPVIDVAKTTSPLPERSKEESSAQSGLSLAIKSRVPALTARRRRDFFSCASQPFCGPAFLPQVISPSFPR